MQNSLSLIALRPHGNIASDLAKQEDAVRKESQQILYPLRPIFFPILTLQTIPASKQELRSVLNPIKEELAASKIQIQLTTLIHKDNWLYAKLEHPVFGKDPKLISAAQFPPFLTQFGIPLAFSKQGYTGLRRLTLQNTYKLRVFTLSVLNFSWNENSEFSFSWDETGKIWVKT